jgi:hypothetical protein
MYSNRFFPSSADTRRRRSLATATLLALALSVSTTGVASADSVSPGKNAAFVSATGVLTTYTTQPVATIAKGRRNTVLAIEASYSDGASYPTPAGMRVLGMQVYVNGVGVQPNPFGTYEFLTDCGFVDTDSNACSVTGTWWLDIDAAELANPGQFVGQPLTVSLMAGDLAAGPLVGIVPMDTSLTVRVTKK